MDRVEKCWLFGDHFLKSLLDYSQCKYVSLSLQREIPLLAVT
jgi:hypothetical protein